MRHPHVLTPPLVAIAHGSRDPRGGAAIADLLAVARARAAAHGLAGLEVRGAFLGHAPPAPRQVLAALAGQGAAERAEPHKLWSVDEVVDAGDTKIAKAARTYYSQHVHNEQAVSDASTILRSPTLFGQFSLSALFSTLPLRSAE